MSKPEPTPPPQRAYSQGVGTVFQFVGVIMFLVMMFICCGSGLLSKDVATKSNLTELAWGRYSAQQAITINVFGGMLFGMALACVGLGLQAQSRVAAPAAVIVSLAGTLFSLFHAIFGAKLQAGLVSFFIVIPSLIVSAVFAILLAFAIGAAKEMKANPPPPGFDVLPPDYKIPYSHYHEDPPEIRLARELEQRRQRLAVQQKELEMLEERLKKELRKKKDV